MDLIYRQLGLEENDETRVKVHQTLFYIKDRLRNLKDNGPIEADGPLGFINVANNATGRKIASILETLAEHKIIQYQPIKSEPVLLFRIFVTNRYKLELLFAELKWMVVPENKQSTKPTIDNLACYDPQSGRGLVNGNPVYLIGRSKKLFKVLSSSSPNPVSKKDLEAIARHDHKGDDLKYAMNDSFSALRKACKVDKSVIFLREDGGRLNAKVFPLAIQLFDNTFGAEEIILKTAEEVRYRIIPKSPL